MLHTLTRLSSGCCTGLAPDFSFLYTEITTSEGGHRLVRVSFNPMKANWTQIHTLRREHWKSIISDTVRSDSIRQPLWPVTHHFIWRIRTRPIFAVTKSKFRHWHHIFTQILVLFILFSYNSSLNNEHSSKTGEKIDKKSQFWPVSIYFKTCHILAIRHLGLWPVTRDQFRTGQRVCDAWRPDWIRAYSSLV